MHSVGQVDGGEAQANKWRRGHVASGIANMCITHRYVLLVSLCWLVCGFNPDFLYTQPVESGIRATEDDMVLDKVLLSDITEMEGKTYEVYKRRSKAAGACARVRACSACGCVLCAQHHVLSQKL